MDIAKILEAGAQYGLDGKVLADFLRDERTAQRESEKEAAAVQAKTALAQLEIERLDKANAEREKERQHELEVLQLQRQTAEALAAQREVGEPVAKGVKPKLPPFDDSKEEIDAYLHRFERYANAQKWDKSTWSTSLSALLKAKPLAFITDCLWRTMTIMTLSRMPYLRDINLPSKGFEISLERHAQNGVKHSRSSLQD